MTRNAPVCVMAIYVHAGLFYLNAFNFIKRIFDSFVSNSTPYSGLVKMENLSSCAHVVYINAKHVISRREKGENGSQMYKNENCKCKACETTVFHC